MEKQDNFQVNFSLKGFSSIQIGLYILLAAYAIKGMLSGFSIDDNPMGFMSAQIIEILIFVVAFFTFIFSSFAIFFKGRRKSRKFNYKLWNAKTKSTFWKYIFSFLIIFIILIIITNLGFVDFITPTFLILYAITLFLLKEKGSKSLYIISGISLLLALICFIIPSYWYSSLFILGVAHITFGLIKKY